MGETGTGKELIANELHRQSARIKNALIKVNCAAIQDTLLESELFGHVKGAFTDAHNKKIGKLQLADEGTLVLDEISNMSWAIQAKILRAVDNQQFEMVGGTTTHNVNARIVSISNKDLMKLVNQHKFRDDLFYRLSTVTLIVPPLRERLEDIPLLTRHYINMYRERYKKKHIIKSVALPAIEKLQQYFWPGNIRELKNVLEQAVLFCSEKQISDKHILFSGMRSVPTGGQILIEHIVENLSTNGYNGKMTEALEDIEYEWICYCMKKVDYVQKDAANLMGISRRMIHYKIQKHQQRTGKEIGYGV
jgi:transcriptional regulator with GAF, ATPase, and Fis domain